MDNAKNPGTICNTVAPQLEDKYNWQPGCVAEPATAEVQAPPVVLVALDAEDTCVDNGPTKTTPTKMATKPPIKFAIIFY